MLLYQAEAEANKYKFFNQSKLSFNLSESISLIALSYIIRSLFKVLYFHKISFFEVFMAVCKSTFISFGFSQSQILI
jgi:hypothetical protein